ncbi:MAG: CapA family protein [Eggerthellaceae bacterium]|nr:CapA family protein [Eggerthellaceae bacterium]
MEDNRQQREMHYSHERNPLTPRARREGTPRSGGAADVSGAAGRRPVSRERVTVEARSSRAARASEEGADRGRAGSRRPAQDYGYVGGRPSRSSGQRVSGWTSGRKGMGSGRRGQGGRANRANRSIYSDRQNALSRINLPLILIALLVVGLLVFAGTRIASCVAAGQEETGGGAASAGVSEGGLSGKLAGSTETVDENGIVHGVTPEGIRYTVRGRGESALQADKVTLVAAGDQIGTDQVLELTDAYAGSMGDGEYSFMPFYQEVAPFVGQYDLRFINQETIMAGEEEYDYSGWPSFNTPDAAADAISQVGFNIVNHGTNHTLDYSLYGIEQSHKVWDRYPQLLVTGTYSSQEERDTVHMVERNGMTFAVLSYCYGDNYLGTYENFPNTYCLAGFDKETMTKEVQRAQAVADAVIVMMHWGEEYTVEPSDQQWEYARFLADLDVDLVLGTHAHIMQKTAYVTGETGNTVPVVFGLSDFVSGWTTTDYILSGLFTCDFTRAEDGSVNVGNLAWHPTIEWSDGGQTYVRFLKDMDEATTNANVRTEDVSDDYTYLRGFIEKVGMEIPVVL